MKIPLLHGIKHNLFGKRGLPQYGTITLAESDRPRSGQSR